MKRIRLKKTPKPKGGKRPGAGRKKGSITRLSRDLIERAKKEGELPHEFLLRIARSAVIANVPVTLDQRLAAAKAAAPYFAPKLSSIALTGKDGEILKVLNISPGQLEGLSTDQLKVLEGVFGQLSGKHAPVQTAQDQEGDADAYAKTLH